MILSAVCPWLSHDIPECRAPLMVKDTDKALVRYNTTGGGGSIIAGNGMGDPLVRKCEQVKAA